MLGPALSCDVRMMLAERHWLFHGPCEPRLPAALAGMSLACHSSESLTAPGRLWRQGVLLLLMQLCEVDQVV